MMATAWQSRVKELFLAARARPPERREGYLDEACGEDVELRREIESLLVEHDRQSAGADTGEFAGEAAPAPTDDRLVGGTLGRYRILRLVGKGGMGAVYEAEDPKLRRKVALKVLPEAFAADPKRLERFQREARSVAALSHPNIVTLYSVEAAPSSAGSGDTHFLTMELVRGEPLDRMIPEEGLDLGEILSRGTQLAEGLRAAHDAGIVHRDLKPANVIVDTEGRIRILDFGLAKIESARPASSQADTSVALTAHGAVLGTAPYMSPEQVAGRACDHRSDIFSLGSILYEMSTGRRPFSGEGFTQVMSAILQDDPTPVTGIRADLPEGLERIVNRCLEKDPAKRFQTARELGEALEELKVHLHAGTRRLAGAKWVTLAVAVAVLTGVGVFTLKPGAEQPSTDEGPATVAPARKMIAVLPFQNLGSSQDEYFAIGMTEEIASRMASVRSLGVIATSSTRQYAGTHKTAREIGKELGAGYLVTGSILWAHGEDGSSRIRITPQLISTVDETQIWAQSYERVLDDIFAIQTEIASQVVIRLGISLADSEKAAVAQFPTENMEAYDGYLRVLAIPFDATDPSWALSRIEKLYRVVELDPDFALAWFLITNGHSFLYASGYDTSEERQRLTLEAAHRVEEAAPGSALAASAMGHYLYRIERNYDRALEELTLAVELDPNSSRAFWLRGSVLRRRANFEGAVASYESGLALDPRNVNLLTQLGIARQYLRHYERAIDAFDRAIALTDLPMPYPGKVVTLWSWVGHRAAARRTLEAFPTRANPVTEDYLWYWQAVYERDFRAAAERIRTTRGEWLGSGVYLRPRELLAGLARLWLGESNLADRQFELAVAKLQARLADAPDNEKVLSSLGVALAALGRRDEALEAALRATEIVPLATDPWFAQSHIEDLAWVYTLLGDHDAALQQLEVLLERPSRITISFLELDPRWAPLRDHPKYQELEDRYGELGSVAESKAS